MTNGKSGRGHRLRNRMAYLKRLNEKEANARYYRKRQRSIEQLELTEQIMSYFKEKENDANT